MCALQLSAKPLNYVVYRMYWLKKNKLVSQVLVIYPISAHNVYVYNHKIYIFNIENWRGREFI